MKILVKQWALVALMIPSSSFATAEMRPLITEETAADYWEATSGRTVYALFIKKGEPAKFVISAGLDPLVFNATKFNIEKGNITGKFLDRNFEYKDPLTITGTGRASDGKGLIKVYLSFVGRQENIILYRSKVIDEQLENAKKFEKCSASSLFVEKIRPACA